MQTIIQAALKAAMQTAASGQYQAAGTLLDAFDSSGITVEVHLLRAKIAAQQGRYEEAITHWQEVLSLVPDNREAQRGVELAQELKTKRGGSFYLRANLYYAILLLTIVGLITLLLFMVSRNAGHSDPASAEAILEAQERQFQLSREIAESLKAVSNKGQLNEAEEKLNDIKIDVPGISVRNDGDGLALLFDVGLFEGGGIDLRPEAMRTLISLGHQLEPYIGRIFISVVGHTDNVAMPVGGRHRDNTALAMARAVAVVEYLRAKTQLPSSMFSARGLGESMTPYANDAPDGRARNRTVVMQVSKVRR